MDLNKCGAFICEQRKSKGMTQQELAERIGVTNKAVSRWETGKGFPDVSVLVSLAEVLDVSVTELVCGEKSADNAKQSDSAVIGALTYARKMCANMISVAFLIFGIVLFLSPLYVAGTAVVPIMLFGAGLIFVSIAILKRGAFMKLLNNISLSKTTSGIISFVFIIAALLLEMFTKGAVLVFASPEEGGEIRRTYSYFDLTPYGYANFSPLITALLSLAIFIMGVIILIFILRKKKCPRLRNAAFICTVIASVISILPILYGEKYITVSGTLITIALILSAVFQAFFNRE